MSVTSIADNDPATAETVSARPARQVHWLPVVVLTALILFHVISNIIWLQQDGRSLYGDTGNHARASMTIFEVLRTPSLDMLSRINQATTFWPPLAYFMTQPLYIVLGVATDVTLFTSTLWFALAILFTYFIGRKLYSRNIGLLAAFVFSFYPAVYLHARTYYVDMALTAMVLISLFCLLRTDAFRDRKASLTFGFVLGLAALTKNAFIIMTIGPLLAVVGLALTSGGLAAWRQLLSWRPKQPLDPLAKGLLQRLLNIALAGGLVILLAAPWYLTHLNILAFNAGEVTRDVHLASKPLLWYPLKFDEALLIWPYLLLLVGLAVGLLRFRRHWFVVLWLISGVVIITMVTRQNVRYLLPVMPAAALLSAHWIVSLRYSSLRAVLIGVTALFQVALFFVMSWGAPAGWNAALNVPVQNAHNPFNDNNSNRPLAIDPLAFLYYQYPPRQHRWPVQEITAAVIADIEASGQANQVNQFVSLSKLLDFEYSTFAYEAELARMQGQPGAINLAVGDVPQRNSYLTDFLDFNYVLVKSNDSSSLANRQNHRITRDLWNSGDAVLRQRFTPLQRWQLQDGSSAELYKRDGPPLALLSPQELQPILQHVLELTPQNEHAQRLLAQLDTTTDPAQQAGAAVQLWRGVVRADPNNAAAWQKLVDALLSRDAPLALREIQQAQQRRGLYRATQIMLYQQQGRVLEAMGQIAEAEAAYRAALDLAPDNAAAQAALGAFLQRQGQPERAQEYLETALRLQSDSSAVLMELAEAFIADGQTEKAIEYLESLLSSDPSHRRAALQLARLYQAEGDLQKAIATLEEVGQRSNLSADDYVILGELHLASGNPAAAREAFLAALRLQQENIDAYLGLGQAMQAEGDSAGALGAYQAGLATAPGNARLIDALTALGQIDEAARDALVALAVEKASADAQALITLSQTLQQSGDFAAAEAALLRGVEVAPQQSALWLALADLYLQQGQVDQAETAFAQAAAAAPDDYQVLLRQVQFYENQAGSAGASGADRYWSSIRDGYRRVIELNPKLMRAYTSLAQGYRTRGEFDAALELLAQGLVELPDDPWLTFATAQVYSAMQNPEQALPYYQQAASKRPDDGWFQLNLAHTYRLLRRWDQAVETYRVALRLTPNLFDDAAVQNNIGLSALNAQQYDLARSSLERALLLRPEFPAAQLFLAQTLEQTGDVDGAKAGYARVIELAPDSDFARTAASRLQNLSN